MQYEISPNIKIDVISNGELNPIHAPVWHLADGSFKIGDCEDGYELEKLALASAGSYEWYGDAVDTVLFSTVSGELHTVVLKLPQRVEIVEKNCFSTRDALKQKGIPVLIRKNNFRLEQSDISIYFTENDTLILALTTDLAAFKYDEIIEIHKFINIIFYQGTYVGWLISKASSFIPYCAATSDNNLSRLESPMISKCLTEYLRYFSQETVVLLDAGDPVIEGKLRKFKSEIATENNKCLGEIELAIDNLIDTYF